MKKAELDLYTDYWLSRCGLATATGLSAMVDGAVSHDKVTRFLSGPQYTSKDWWAVVKPTVRSIEGSEGVLIFDVHHRRPSCRSRQSTATQQIVRGSFTLAFVERSQ